MQERVAKPALILALVAPNLRVHRVFIKAMVFINLISDVENIALCIERSSNPGCTFACSAPSCLYCHMQKGSLQKGSTGSRQTSHHPIMEHIQVLRHRLCPSSLQKVILNDSNCIILTFSEHITHSIASVLRSVDRWPLLKSLTPPK